MSFKIRVILIVVATCFICTLAAVFISANRVHKVGTESLINKSRAILSRLEAVRSFVATQDGLRDKMTKATKLYPNGDLSQDMKLEILKQVPIFASIKIGEEAAEKEHYQFRVFADDPRNKDHQATEIEKVILQKFDREPNLPEIISENSDQIILYRPVRLSEKQGCLNCHGDPADSPWKNGKDILGHQMENWKDQKLHGVFSIASDKAEIKAAANSATLNIILWSVAATAFVLLLAYKFIRSSINEIVDVSTSLKEAGEQVSIASAAISKSAQALSTATTQAAASIEETTASIEEVSSMIQLTSKNAATAKDLSQLCEKNAKNGKLEVDKLIVSINDMTNSSKKIEEITTVIDDIAFQTNLLALNAAVEAARAGEQGKGFAVVADAVRSLAQKSATSAKEISVLIKESVEKNQHGSETAEASGKVLTSIVENVENVSKLNIEISNSSAEQATGVDQINKAAAHLDLLTQQNAEGAEKTASASEQLSAQAIQLHTLVEKLNEIIDGKK